MGSMVLIQFWWYPPDLIDGVSTKFMSYHEACGFVSVICPPSLLERMFRHNTCTCVSNGHQALLPVVLGPGNEAGPVSTSQYWGWHLSVNPLLGTVCCCYGKSLHPLVREYTSYLDVQCIQLHKYCQYKCLQNLSYCLVKTEFPTEFTNQLWSILLPLVMVCGPFCCHEMEERS